MTDFILINRAGGGARVPRRTLAAVWARAQKQHPRRFAKKRLSLVFVTAAEARRLNKLYRGKNKVANVLAFPSALADEVGDILICPAVAQTEARAQGQSRPAWLAYLWAHALMHLAGFDHHTPLAARRMEAAIAKILA